MMIRKAVRREARFILIGLCVAGLFFLVFPNCGVFQ